MIPTLAAVLGLTLLGVPVTLAVDRRARGTLLAGLSFLYGSGTIFLVLMALSVAEVRWTPGAVTLGALAVFALATAIAIRQRPTQGWPGLVWPHPIDALTLVTLVGYAQFASPDPLWEWDFWAIWGLKAKLFLESGGIDWRFLESPLNIFAHGDYPLLVPLDYALASLVAGGWSDRWPGLFFAAWGAALLLVARGLASRETTPFYAALLTLAMTGVGLSLDVGLAEGALIAFGGTGVLMVREALRDDDPAAWRHAALMLGFAANCKNEGIALLLAVTLALLAVSGSRGRAVARLPRLWPAYALAAPWIVLRIAHALPTDIIGGSVMERFAARLGSAHEIFAFLAERLHKPWFWAAILAGLLVVPAAMRRRERFVIIVTAIEILLFVAAYFVTPHDVRWHVITSWARLTGQVAVPIAFAVFLMLAQSLRGGQAPPPVTGGIAPGRTKST
jgi:hypothetical protein